jgi:hypothetical protein
MSQKACCSLYIELVLVRLKALLFCPHIICSARVFTIRFTFSDGFRSGEQGGNSCVYCCHQNHSLNSASNFLQCVLLKKGTGSHVIGYVFKNDVTM